MKKACADKCPCGGLVASFGYTTTPVLSVSGTYEPPIIEAYIVIGQGLTPAAKF